MLDHVVPCGNHGLAVFARDRGASVVVLAPGAGLGILGVPDGKRLVVGLAQGGQGGMGEHVVLVGEALALFVDEQALEGSHLVADLHVLEVEQHGGSHLGLLPSGADPQAHLVAGALIHAALDVPDPLGAVGVDHLVVGAEVSRGKHHGLRAHELRMAVILFGYDGRHAALAAVLTNELLAGNGEAEVAAEGGAVGGEVLHDVLLRVFARGCGGVGSADEVVGSPVLADDVLGVLVVRLEHGRQVAAAVRAACGHDVDEPVHRLFGAVGVQPPLILVNEEGMVAHHLLVCLGDIGMNALFVHKLGAHDESRSAAAHGDSALGNERDANALLEQSRGSDQARGAAANDNDVVLDGVGNLVIGDGLGRNLEGPLGILGLFRSHNVRGLVGKGNGSARCRRGDEGCRARGALDEVPACDFARAHDKPLPQGWARRQAQIPADCRRLRFLRWRHLLPFSLSAPPSSRKYRGWG